MEVAPVIVEIDEDLGSWSVEIPGRVTARAEALAGPTTPAGARVQIHNAGGAEVGPGQIATWAAPPPTRPTHSASAGTAAASPASISRSTGVAPTD